MLTLGANENNSLNFNGNLLCNHYVEVMLAHLLNVASTEVFNLI